MPPKMPGKQTEMGALSAILYNAVEWTAIGMSILRCFV